MNVIVKRHYPVEKLPADLREQLSPGTSEVTVTLEAMESAQTRRRSISEVRAEVGRLRREGKITPVSSEEAVARVRALRDEWDD